ncbi:hypothetical protein [Gilvimarinus chinensis]|uniref:hypothetical protein n=1 Tax=Gilvimarinus chinensis TaxID=396005 RepID=UPI00036F70C0|nr:hypothetical protein [Gilvimarinus chinensis]
MNSITIIIIILVAAMVIGPVAMMRPSPAQKRREAIRAYAFKQGLGVTVRRPPQIPTDLDAPSLLPAYTIKIKGGEGWALRRASYKHESHVAQHWHLVQGALSASSEAFLNARLPDLSARIVAITSATGELAVLWHESHEPADVEGVRNFLVALAEVEQARIIRS